MKMVDVPPAVKNVPLGQKRKRGWPSLAKEALMIQEEDNRSISCDVKTIDNMRLFSNSISILIRILQSDFDHSLIFENNQKV